MAKAKNPFLSVVAAGRLGKGLSTFRDKPGTRFRGPARGGGVKTTRRLEIRAVNAYLMDVWRFLEASEREQWERYALLHPRARSAKTARLPGQLMFISVNLYLYDALKTFNRLPPWTDRAPIIRTLTASRVGDVEVDLTWAFWPLTGDPPDVVDFSPGGEGESGTVPERPPPLVSGIPAGLRKRC